MTLKSLRTLSFVIAASVSSVALAQTSSTASPSGGSATSGNKVGDTSNAPPSSSK